MKKTLLFIFSLFLITTTSLAQWELLPGGGVGKKIWAYDSKVWVIGSDDGIYYSTSAGGWAAYPGQGKGRDLSVHNGIPYILGTDDRVYKGSSSGWSLMAGGGMGKSIHVDAAGTIWLIGSDNGVYYQRQNSSAWVAYPGKGTGYDLCAYDDLPYVVGTDFQVYRGSPAGNWTLLGQGFKCRRITVDNTGTVWALADNGVFYFDNPNKKWVVYDATGKGFDITVMDNRAYLIGTDSKVYKGVKTAGIAAVATLTPVTPKDPAELAKDAIHTIWLAYQSWSATSGTYLEPQEYIKDASGKITGQNFLYPSYDEKLAVIKLNWANNEIPEGNIRVALNSHAVKLTWHNQRIVNVKINGLSGFDYAIEHDEKGEISSLTGNELMNGSIRFVKKIELSEGRITKITSYENKSSDPWIRSITTYTYAPEETTVAYIVYGTGKSNTDKNIVSDQKAVYKKSKGNPYIIAQPWGVTTEMSYNEKDLISHKKTIARAYVEEQAYQYREGKLFKQEKTRNNIAGEFQERSIQIYFSLTDQPASAPDYEKTQGTYKFNKDGELIWESRDMKYREKVNGAWSEWKNFRY
jgi:hypothetical protein